MEQFVQDVRFSLRTLLQRPAFTVAVVAALALGIGATTAVFSVVNAILLRPFPYPDPDRIVFFMSEGPMGRFPFASPAKYAHWRRQTDIVQDAAALRTVTVNYTGGDVPEQVRSGSVSEAFFRLWGARTQIGRTFSKEEDSPNGPKVALLSNGWWKRRFASDPGVIGKPIALGGEMYVVIGVLAADFDPSEFMSAPEVWTPFQTDPNSADHAHYFSVAARLRPGVSLAQAQAKVEQSASEFRQRFPTALLPRYGFSLDQMEKVVVRDSRTLLVVLLAAVSGVLLIACANVANLLLVRSTARKREIAIRAAIGAGRGRVVRQLLTESLLLSVIGGALGLTLGLLGIRALLSVNTADLPRIGQAGASVDYDWRLLAFTAAASVFTTLLFGVAPALHAVRGNLSAALRDGSASSGAARTNRVQSALVVLEIALALTLVIGSALLVRTSIALRAVAPGFDATNVLTMQMAFAGPRFQTALSVDQAIRHGVERIRAIPGVVVASAACCLPLELESGFREPFRIIGRPLEAGATRHGLGSWVTAAPGYFEVFRIPVLRGRTFTDQDRAGTPAVVVINETMANAFWANRNPIGERLAIGRGATADYRDEPDREVIGVVADSRNNGLNQAPFPQMFVPQAQILDRVNASATRASPTAWVIRTSVPPMSLSAAVQEQLRVALGLPVANVRSMEDVVSRSTSRERFNMLLMTVFAASALALAAIGIYAVMAFAVQQRTREIGIRLALGAAPGVVRRMVVLQGLRLAFLGVFLGVGAALGLSRYIASLLFGVAPRDPAIFVGVPILLSLTALAAVWIPAGRASRVDPLGALRAP